MNVGSYALAVTKSRSKCLDTIHIFRQPDYHRCYETSYHINLFNTEASMSDPRVPKISFELTENEQSKVAGLNDGIWETKGSYISTFDFDYLITIKEFLRKRDTFNYRMSSELIDYVKHT